MSKPATCAVPLVGGSSVVSILISVLLPAPFGPEQAEDGCGFSGEGQMIDGDQRVVTPGEIEHLDGRAGGNCLSPPH